MKRDKDGTIIFETEAEFDNYWKYEMNEQKIRAEIEKKDFKINYHDRHMVYRVLKKAINRLDDSKYRDGKKLMNVVVDAMYWHGIKRDYVLQWFVDDWKLTYEQVKDIERRAAAGIIEQLKWLRIPLTFSEIIKQGGF